MEQGQEVVTWKRMRKWIAYNKLKEKKEDSLHQYYHSNYSTPVTSQVEALDNHSANLNQCLNNIKSNTKKSQKSENTVHFNLPNDHIDKNIKEW